MWWLTSWLISVTFSLADSALTVSVAFQEFIQTQIPRDDLSEALQHILQSAEQWHVHHRNNPEKLRNLLDDQSNDQIVADPHCDVIFGSKLIGIATLTAIRFYIETMATNHLGLAHDLSALIASIQSPNVHDLKRFKCSESINITKSSDYSPDQTLKCRQKLMIDIERKYFIDDIDTVWTAWSGPLESTFKFITNLVITKPLFIQSLSPMNLSVTDELGHGSHGTVYKVADLSFPGIFYAVKHFEDIMLCQHEERILLLFHSDRLFGAPIAHLLLHHLVCCSEHNAFLMQFVDGQSVHALSREIARRHHPSGDPLRFIRDLGDQMIDALTVYFEIAGVYHGDINGANIMYNVETGRFYLIDFGLAHNLNDNQRLDFGGSWQNFGPSAYALMVAMAPSNDSAKSVNQRNLNRKHRVMAMEADIYAVRSVQMEVIPRFASAVIDRGYLEMLSTLQRRGYEVGRLLNAEWNKSEGRFHGGFFLPLHRLWKERSDVAGQFMVHSNTAFCWIHQMAQTLLYRVDDSMWFQSIGDDRWNDAVDVVYSNYTLFLDRKMMGNHRISFQEIMAMQFYYVPSFVLNEDVNAVFNQMANRSEDEQRIFDQQRAGRIALQFLKLYCDHHMTGHRDQWNCELLKNLKIKGVIPGGPIWEMLQKASSEELHDIDGTASLTVPDGRDIVYSLQPMGHPLFRRIGSLLWDDQHYRL